MVLLLGWLIVGSHRRMPLMQLDKMLNWQTFEPFEPFKVESVSSACIPLRQRKLANCGFSIGFWSVPLDPFGGVDCCVYARNYRFEQNELL